MVTVAVIAPSSNSERFRRRRKQQVQHVTEHKGGDFKEKPAQEPVQARRDSVHHAGMSRLFGRFIAVRVGDALIPLNGLVESNAPRPPFQKDVASGPGDRRRMHRQALIGQILLHGYP